MLLYTFDLFFSCKFTRFFGLHDLQGNTVYMRDLRQNYAK